MNVSSLRTRRPARASGRTLALLLAGLLAVGGCDHVTDPDGPLLVDRFGDFFVVEPLDANRDAVDFAAGEDVVFTAVFNKQVNWILEITGDSSGAVKRIEGFSNELTAENARWAGGTTELPLFKDEPASAALLILDAEADTMRVAVNVLTPKEYPGAVIADFENVSRPHITLGNFEFELEPETGASAEVPPAEGDAFYLFRGTDDVVANYFAGLIDIRPEATGRGFFPVPTTVPEELFFNMFLYSFGTPNTIAVVQLIVDANGTGAFEDGRDTVLPYGDVPVDWTGWRHFHKPVSELGLTESQAGQIVAVRVLLISNRDAQPDPPLQVEYGIDYLTFTAGAPLAL